MIGELEFEIPDLVEPIRAWRCWHVGTEDTPLLHSPQHQTDVWPPVGGWDSKTQLTEQRDFVTARCRATGTGQEAHPCPSPSGQFHSGKGCGLYAYHDMEDLSWDFPLDGVMVTTNTKSDIVWGRVLLWGHVFEHERGYRAEHARIESLVKVEGLGSSRVNDRLEEIALFYGVPLEHVGKEAVEKIATYWVERTRRETTSRVQKAILALVGFALTFGERMAALADNIRNSTNPRFPAERI